MMLRIAFIVILVLLSKSLNSQNTSLDSALTYLQKKKLFIQEERIDEVKVGGGLVSALITDGDTLFIYELENVNVSSPRTFSSRNDYLRYRKYRRYAAKVYPFAQEAMRIFREAEYISKNMKKRKRKKYMRQLSKSLQKEFEEPLKKLSKTQGKILVKMIERELDESMFNLIKMVNGKFKAFYWNQSSKLYGYRLKTGYIVGQNPILDVVLQDFDISYQVEEL